MILYQHIFNLRPGSHEELKWARSVSESGVFGTVSDGHSDNSFFHQPQADLAPRRPQSAATVNRSWKRLVRVGDVAMGMACDCDCRDRSNPRDVRTAISLVRQDHRLWFAPLGLAVRGLFLRLWCTTRPEQSERGIQAELPMIRTR